MLPHLIEIVPPSHRIDATVVLPGSKSLTNRALILAALASRPVVLRGSLWSEDTQAMVDCLERLGFRIEVANDPAEPANRTLTVHGCGGRIPNAGTAAQPLELFVENAGTAARFLPPFLCLGQGAYRVSGIPRMHERPQASLIHALRELGYRIDSANDRLPAVIHGTGPRPGATCSVSVEESSQFASALLLSERIGGWTVRVTGGNEDELPYVEMTRRLVNDFPWDGGVYVVEPDASAASYFWGADWLLRDSGSRIRVMPAPSSGMQADQKFRDLVLERAWQPVFSRSTDLADSIMTAIVLAPFARSATQFVDLGRLRVQECERVEALRTELTKCGARVEETGDTLRIDPGPLHGAEIETYDDHRIAMCFGMLGLRVPGIRLRDPKCVRKTFPNFFAKLAELGAVIQDASLGTRLSGDDLLA
ncbi:3-phosphoshikimate 1-carboxyvinyltransferase [Rhodoplanes sp. Z2-YC6860]|uniref:3-phosphoshikimate 1-carboxyvinyltransferase n=1 Tax=Rhodoplanes sp. Z2-YC6860 TaxID=674703 RepID=UPI00078C4DEA|nr:3-phosphoshikimate 1-carboxyvinyltransferase [Rhodoplanes sp. Z2-YC6860]AMN43123.1 3-phosphoshikimate 1-carboxyvinyltransferase [Rhodoplanes sp. Z2-YC6860]